MVDSSLALALSLAHIERGLNQALAYSIHWPEYAEKLNNHVLRCELLPMNKSIFVFFQHNQISLKSIGPEQVDLTISAPPSALLDMIQKKRTSTAIHIFGNAHLAQILQQAISAVDIDWEGLLADRIGDIPAKQASFIFKKLKGFTQHFMARSLSDTADYLVDEKQLLPSRLEVDAFYEDIHPLHSAVDRLEARIRALEIKHAE